MRAGPLRHRITIQQNSPTQDGTGYPMASWSTFATVWAAIEPLRGREFLEAKGLQEETSVRITIRHQTGIDPSMRVAWTDGGGTAHTYDIVAVLPFMERNRFIELMCREII